MKRYVILCNVFCLIMVVPSADLSAQFHHKLNSENIESSNDPRVRHGVEATSGGCRLDSHTPSRSHLHDNDNAASSATATRRFSRR
jgi:hypothetical protein